MSVINSVLKEIDDRPALFRPVDLGGVKSKGQSAAGGRVFLLTTALFLVVLLIGLLAYSLGFSLSGQEQAVSSGSRSEEAVIETAPVSVAPVTGQPDMAATNQPLDSESPVVPDDQSTAAVAVVKSDVTYLTGLQITESAGSLELWFQFNQDFSHFLKRRSGNRYQFQISDAVSEIEPPSFDGQWLNAFDIRVDQEHLLLDLVTANKVLLSTSDTAQGKDYYWIVKLERLTEEPSKYANPRPLIEPTNTDAKPEHLPEVSAEKAIPQPEVKLAIKPAIRPESNQQRLEVALAELQAGRWRQAVDQFRNLIGSDVDRQARLNLLALYQSQQRSADFDSFLQLSLAQYPNDGEFQVIDANRLFQKGLYGDLVNRYSAVVDPIQVVGLTAAAYQRLGNHQLAVNAYQRALQVDAGQVKNWISLAISLEKLGQDNKALDAYRTALESNGLNSRLKKYVSGRISALTAGN